MKPLSDEAIARVKECELYDDIKSGELDCETCSGNCRQVAQEAQRDTLRQVDTWLKVHGIFTMMSPRVRDEWQEFKGQAEVK